MPLIATPKGLASISKTKKANIKKTHRPRAVSAGPASRWTLTESAKDLFTIRIFNRIEADEMLPESVLHEIRMSRATQARLAREAETSVVEADTDTETSPTQSDTLFFNDVSPNLDSQGEFGALLETQKQSRSRSTTPTQERPSNHPTAQEQESPTDVINDYNNIDEPLPFITTDPEQYSQPKAKASKNTHRRPPNRQMPPLPTIPEIMVTNTGAEKTFISPTSRRKGTSPTARLNTDDYVYFPGTPYTLTAPSFRHGPIRLAKADLPIGQLAAAVDDTLDWTAFQMAILGGANDFYSEATDYSRPADVELDEQDDIAAWFAGFGFKSPGNLIPANEAICLDRMERAALRNTLVEAPASIPSTPSPPPPPSVIVTPVAEEASAPPAELPRRASGQTTRIDPPIELSRGYMISANGIGAGQEGVGGWVGGFSAFYSRPRSTGDFREIGALDIPHKNRVSTASEKSLPQSPMLDLVVSRDVDGNEYVVPMGFNLGHDLGDFLKWEADHVFGGGYYGPDPV